MSRAFSNTGDKNSQHGHGRPLVPGISLSTAFHTELNHFSHILWGRCIFLPLCTWKKLRYRAMTRLVRDGAGALWPTGCLAGMACKGNCSEGVICGLPEREVMPPHQKYFHSAEVLILLSEAWMIKTLFELRGRLYKKEGLGNRQITLPNWGKGVLKQGGGAVNLWGASPVGEGVGQDPWGKNEQRPEGAAWMGFKRQAAQHLKPSPLLPRLLTSPLCLVFSVPFCYLLGFLDI